MALAREERLFGAFLFLPFGRRIALGRNSIGLRGFFFEVGSYIGIGITLLSPFVFLRSGIVGPMFLAEPFWSYFIGVILIYLFLCLYYLNSTGGSHWYYGMLFAVCYLSVLCWQTFYAMTTVNKTHWGTR